MHLSRRSFHLACVCAVLSGCASAGVLSIWPACVQRKAGALPGVCSDHLACVCAVLSGCTSAGVLTIWHACVQRKAGSLQRVFLPYGMRVCSAERVLLRGCSYHVGGGKNHFDLRVGKYPVPFSGDWDVHWWYDLTYDPWPGERRKKPP